MITRLILFLGLLLYSTGAICQQKSQPDSVAYLMINDTLSTDNQEQASFLRLIIKAGVNMFDIQDYYMDSTPKLTAHSSIGTYRYQSGVDGKVLEYYKDGSKKSEKTYSRGKLQGDYMEYYIGGALHLFKKHEGDVVYLIKNVDSTGNILADKGNGSWIKTNENFDGEVLSGKILNGREEGIWEQRGIDSSIYKIEYKNGIIISGHDYLARKHNILLKTDIEPSFVGGLPELSRYLGRNLRYPTVARDRNIQGRVILTFIVEADGSLKDIKVVRAPDKSLGDEALRVLNMSPNWTPAMRNGKPVRVQYAMPIAFTLKTESGFNRP